MKGEPYRVLCKIRNCTMLLGRNQYEQASTLLPMWPCASPFHLRLVQEKSLQGLPSFKLRMPPGSKSPRNLLLGTASNLENILLRVAYSDMRSPLGPDFSSLRLTLYHGMPKPSSSARWTLPLALTHSTGRVLSMHLAMDPLNS